MRTRRIITTAALTVACASLAGLTAWNVEPFSSALRALAVDPGVQDSLRREAATAIVRTRFADLAPGTSVTLDGITASFSLDGPPIAGEMREFRWRVTSGETPTIVDRVMHGIPMHVYAAREDLAGDTVHMHPPEAGEGFWIDRSDFPTAGAWNVYMQFASEGTLYGFRSHVDVSGAPKEAAPPDDERERVLLGYAVSLALPARITAGQPAPATFAVRHAYDVPEKDAKSAAAWTHNLIIVREGGEPQLWNHHGDGSVDAVAEIAPVVVVRDRSGGHPFDYALTFPSPGKWLVDFEYRGESAPFWIDVQAAR